MDPQVRSGAPPMKLQALDPRKTLARHLDRSRRVGCRMTLQERQGLGLLLGRRGDLSRRPAGRHFAQSVDVRLQRIAVIGGDQNRRRRRVGRRDVAGRAQHGAIAGAICVARIQHVAHDRIDPRRIVMGDRQPRFRPHVEPGEKPALLENPVPQPGQVLAISGGVEGRQIGSAERGPLGLSPDRIAADRGRAEPLRRAPKRARQDDAARMKAVGAGPLDVQRVEQRQQGIGEVGNLRTAGQRIGLAETRRVGRDDGEMLRPARH